MKSGNDKRKISLIPESTASAILMLFTLLAEILFIALIKTPAKYSKHNRYNCIDISWWQGKLSDDSWQKIKGAGVTHVIVRCGYSTLRSGEHNMDSTFSNNLNRAYKAGLKVGVYYYSTAVSPAEAKSEAKYVVSVIKNYRDKITLPVAFDYETGGRLTSKVMKSVGTESCKAFCDKIAAERSPSADDGRRISG